MKLNQNRLERFHPFTEDPSPSSREWHLFDHLRKVRIKEDESFDNVVPESSIDSQAIEGPFSKKSQFEDILNSKQNELVFEVRSIFLRIKRGTTFFRRLENPAIDK